jgi:hypothetical protein
MRGVTLPLAIAGGFDCTGALRAGLARSAVESDTDGSVRERLALLARHGPVERLEELRVLLQNV